MKETLFASVILHLFFHVFKQLGFLIHDIPPDTVGILVFDTIVDRFYNFTLYYVSIRFFIYCYLEYPVASS